MAIKNILGNQIVVTEHIGNVTNYSVPKTIEETEKLVNYLQEQYNSVTKHVYVTTNNETLGYISCK